MRKSLFIVLSFNLTSEIEKAAHFGSVLEAASRHEKPQKNRKKTLNIFFVALISGVNGGLRWLLLNTDTYFDLLLICD